MPTTATESRLAQLRADIGTAARAQQALVDAAMEAVAADAVEHANELLLLRATGDDLRGQLDAARRRIAELEGGQTPPVVVPSPIPGKPQPVYTLPPTDARVITDTAQAKAAILQNARDGKPLIIQGSHRDRFRLERGNRNIWFVGGESVGIRGGAEWEAAISWPNGVENVYIHNWLFQDCQIGIYVYDLHQSEIIGCRFAGGSQGVHVMWNSTSRPATGAVITHNTHVNQTGHDVELQTRHPQRWASLGPTVIGAQFNYNRSTGSATLPTRSMVWSLATGHARDCEAIGNYSEGGEWAFEVMNGFTFRDNIAVDCDAMFAINTLSKLVNIGTGNRAIRVRTPVLPYVGDPGAPTGIQTGWQIAEVARQ